MRRRDFISLAALAALGSCDRLGFAKNSRYLVATPQMRAAYLKEMLKSLCTDLGPRPVFYPAYNQGAAIYKREMEKALPQVAFSQCTFKGWKLLSGTEFTLAGKPMEAYACHCSPGTPKEGVKGIITKVEHKNPDSVFYAITDPKSSGILAYILVNGNDALAVPLPSYMNPLEAGIQDGDATFEKQGKWPTLCVGGRERETLEEAAAKKREAFWHAEAEFVPGMKADSVIGTLPGKSTDEILFMGHLDTVYSSPGANDNTASALVILMLAHAVSGLKPGKTLSFFATAGEEYGKLGAVQYKNEREKAGTLKNIKAIIEFDSLTWGNNFQLYSKNTDLLRIVEEANRAAGIKGAPKRFEEENACDGRAFFKTGVPVLYVNTRGENYMHTLKYWHRPEDTPDNVAVELVENGFLAFREVIRAMAGV